MIAALLIVLIGRAADAGSIRAAFVLGFIEGMNGGGMTYDDDACSPRSESYDRGRNLRELVGR